MVIGAGQAGLAMGYYLQQQDKRFLLLDKNKAVGQSWAERYRSLRLFTPAAYCHLPGWPLSSPNGTYPTKDQIATYLQEYARHFQLPVLLNQTVSALTKNGGIFQVQTQQQVFQARQVIIATGPFQTPFVPTFSPAPASGILQLHSSAYQEPGQLPPGKVLVVGAGNSGAQITVELSQTHEVNLSVRKPPRFSSLRKLGKSVFWWATKTGAIFAPPHSFLGKKMLRQTDVIYGRELEQALQKKSITLRPELSRFNVPEALFQDGSNTAFSSIVWCTGFQSDYSWLQVKNALDPGGQPLHQEGISPVAGLFYLGLQWQRSRSSALLLGAGRDAHFLAQRLA
ncbi:hypothetical protein TH63_00870 [Rufibacter radiotolerans]|uniref:Flavoprotein involved in K+ transport n=1 Tax=Rufibacter radiotolerans TaxID=1379910 RepID=A0A0H4VQ16_9BACT|nr:hypothetical protein TH63_00870 [Rufibacter radiotolerans]